MQTPQPVFTDCNNCGSADHREYACACACHSARKRVARLSDETARALRSILNEARHEQEVSLLAHATSTTEAGSDEALQWSVAASGAVDVALRALTSYVANGYYYPSTSCGPSLISLSHLPALMINEPWPCTAIEETSVLCAGWGCCRCRTYNGSQRRACRGCGHQRCDAQVSDTVSAPPDTSGSNLTHDAPTPGEVGSKP